MSDAGFEDGGDPPLRLKAETDGDLRVVSALCQDSVFPATEMEWDRKARRFAVLLNRFRWEHGGDRRGFPPERVQTVLAIDGVLSVRSMGVDRGDAELALSLLSVDWEPDRDAAGRIALVFAGGRAVSVDVECLDVTLKDVTRPYAAVSGHAPRHPD